MNALSGYYARYLPSGHLVYLSEGTLFAAPFDLDRLELIGQAVPVIEGVATSINSAGAQFAASENGTFVYLPAGSSGGGAPMSWMDRAGRVTALRATATTWSGPQFDPDGRRFAVTAGSASDVWVYEWSRETFTRLTFDPGQDSKPVWTPDGQRIAFMSTRGGGVQNLIWQRADGTGDVQRLTESKNTQRTGS